MVYSELQANLILVFCVVKHCRETWDERVDDIDFSLCHFHDRPQGKSYLFFTQFKAEIKGAKIEYATAYVSIILTSAVLHDLTPPQWVKHSAIGRNTWFNMKKHAFNVLTHFTDKDYSEDTFLFVCFAHKKNWHRFLKSMFKIDPQSWHWYLPQIKP